MRARFLLGAAALLGAVSVSGEASAQTETAIPDTCSGIRNAARQSENVPRLENLRRAADRLDCDDDITVLIDRNLNRLKSGGSETATDPSADASSTAAANSTGATSSQTSAAANAAAAARAPANARRTLATRRPLQIGQTVSSNLTSGTPVDPENNVPFELWSFTAQQGENLQVSMTSPDNSLDTYLVVGRVLEDGQIEDIAINDDRGDGTLNSLVCFTTRDPGEYLVRARSFWEGQYGGYNLLVQPASLGRGPATSRPLSVGEAQPGRLGCESPVDSDSGTAYDLWAFQAEAGQVLQISMNSEELDPLISVGQMRDGQFVELGMDDDGGDGLNSLLRVVPDRTGEYLIRARTYAPDQFGNYELLVQATALTSSAQQPVARRANAWVVSSEIPAEGETNYVDFLLPSSGQSYRVRAVSSSFIPVVDVAVLGDGGQLTPIDFYGGSNRASDTAQVPRARPAGRYIVRVTAPAGTSGAFDLIINAAE